MDGRLRGVVERYHGSNWGIRFVDLRLNIELRVAGPGWSTHMYFLTWQRQSFLLSDTR